MTTASEPLHLQHLFPILDQHLLELLNTLSIEDWERPTISPKWKVKDVAAHLLDGNLRALSMLRDEYFGEQPDLGNTDSTITDFLNRLNADWVKAMKRISPSLLIALLASSGRAYCDYITSLDPFAKAQFSVAWAGETVSQNWFHIAREYTEKWHHQQQIRLAVGQEELLYQQELYWPCIDTFMRALPYHFRDQKAPVATLIAIEVEDLGSWFIQKEENGWTALVAPRNAPHSKVVLPREMAWKIFTKGISAEAALRQSAIEGAEYAKHIFSMITIMG